jgi:hypothetical protein
MPLSLRSEACIFLAMSTVKEIEEAIAHLSPDEFKAFLVWFEKYENQQWDSQFEKDVESGRLDSMAQEALNEYEAGNCSRK